MHIWQPYTNRSMKDTEYENPYTTEPHQTNKQNQKPKNQTPPKLENRQKRQGGVREKKTTQKGKIKAKRIACNFQQILKNQIYLYICISIKSNTRRSPEEQEEEERRMARRQRPHHAPEPPAPSLALLRAAARLNPHRSLRGCLLCC